LAGSFFAEPNMKGAADSPLIALPMKPPGRPFRPRICATRCSFRTGRQPGCIFRTCAVTSSTYSRLPRSSAMRAFSMSFWWRGSSWATGISGMEQKETAGN